MEFEIGRLQPQDLLSPGYRDPESENLPPQEEVSLTAERIVWTYTRGNVSCEETTSIYREHTKATS
ncbi:MAG: hypothetical protein U0326_33235 [Polyangiales bacterium]